MLDGEPQPSQHGDGAALAALEIARVEALAGGELISGAQDGLGRVEAFLPDQVVGRGRTEAMCGEKALRPTEAAK